MSNVLVEGRGKHVGSIQSVLDLRSFSSIKDVDKQVDWSVERRRRKLCGDPGYFGPA
jgi:hypothetical protein